MSTRWSAALTRSRTRRAITIRHFETRQHFVTRLGIIIQFNWVTTKKKKAKFHLIYTFSKLKWRRKEVPALDVTLEVSGYKKPKHKMLPVFLNSIIYTRTCVRVKQLKYHKNICKKYEIITWGGVHIPLHCFCRYLESEN